jgi:hypothetical protein
MRKEFLQIVKAIFPTAVGLVVAASAVKAQQHVIAQKNNTRPETTTRFEITPVINVISAVKGHGYSEIQWTASRQDNTRKFIVEYSVNGLDYLTAGEVQADAQQYSLKHSLVENRPMLYRIRSQQLNGKDFYSASFLLDGISVSPIRIYPTVITGNTVNINADWPVERVAVTSSNGTQALVKEIGGQRDYMAVVVPNLGKGMYFMTFYGNGWQVTEKFVVQ